MPAAPGGPTDVVGRVLWQKVGDVLGQPFVLDNRAGAGGNIGGETVAKAAPDGYTLLMAAAGPIVINQSLYAKMPYDSVKEFLPISLVATSPVVLTTGIDSGVKSISELIALVKSKPGEFSYSSPSVGTLPHLTTELLKRAAGLDIQHVPFKGAPPSQAAVMRGDVLFGFDTPYVMPLARAGKIRALAVSTAARSALAPELPTLIESGFPGLETTAWYGIYAPVGTPRAIVLRLNAELVRALADPTVRERLMQLGFEPVGSTPEQLAAHISAEIPKWANAVKLSGAKAD